jgi:hypothetical protein
MKPPFEFGRRSIEIARVILRHRRDGLCLMASFERIGTEYPDLSFYDYWGGHALADCIEAGTAEVQLIDVDRLPPHVAH